MNFFQFLLILRARYKIILLTLVVTVATGLAVTLSLPNTYKATATLLFNYKGTDPVTGNTLPAQLMPGYMATQVDIIKSVSTALLVVDQTKLAESAAIKEMFSEESDGKGNIRYRLAGLLLNNLEVVPSRGSSVLSINFKGADPALAAAIANAFADAYQKASIRLTVEPAQKAAIYFDSQIKLLRDKLEVAHNNLSKYQQEHGIVNVDNHLDVETARLDHLSSQLVAAQGELMGAISSQGSNTDEGDGVTTNLLINDLKASLAQAEAKFAEISQKLGKNHPSYQGSSAEVEKMRSELNIHIRAFSDSMVSRESKIRAALAEQKSKVLTINRARDELTLLSKEVEGTQRAYDAATQRLNQTNLEWQFDQSGVAVLNSAVPPIEPDSPKLLLNMLRSVFLGTLLGVGFGMLAEMLNRRVRSAEDMVEVLQVPVLGVIQSKHRRLGRILMELGKLTLEDTERVLRLQKERGIRFGEAVQLLGLVTEADIQQALARQFDYHYLQPGQGKYPAELVAAYQPFSAQAEILRAVRSQLMLRWFAAGRKELAVASINSGEGASLFTANLAVVFSQLGERTLLIDANLRCPRQHEIFNLGNKQGLSDVLAGHAAANDVISKVGSFVDLSVLPAGTLPPNPQELLSRASFGELSESLVSQFDVVLFDTSAFSTGADTLAIAARAGGVLLVARKNNTRMADINATSEQLGRIGAEVVGSILVDF